MNTSDAEKTTITIASVINAGSLDELSTLDLLNLYKGQHRECWMCDKIADNIENGKEISEDDKWHFSTCVLSWAGLSCPRQYP